jgi:hypothetical protein
MVAEGVREAYVDIFNLNVSANTMTQAEVEGKFKTLTNGAKAPATITQMAKTFVALCGYADWTADVKKETVQTTAEHINTDSSSSSAITVGLPTQENQRTSGFDLNYNIHIHLPATRDQAVYDALFASLTKHIPLK